MATLDQQPRGRKRLRQLLLDTRGLRTPDVLQMQSRSGQHFDASLQDAARSADAGFMLIETLRRTVLAHTHVHAVRPASILIVRSPKLFVRPPLPELRNRT